MMKTILTIFILCALLLSACGTPREDFREQADATLADLYERVENTMLMRMYGLDILDGICEDLIIEYTVIHARDGVREETYFHTGIGVMGALFTRMYVFARDEVTAYNWYEFSEIVLHPVMDKPVLYYAAAIPQRGLLLQLGVLLTDEQIAAWRFRSEHGE
jgi:hypothetical protein